MKALFLVLTPVLMLPAQADWTHSVSPAKLGSHPRLAPTILSYQLSWKGLIQAGKLDFRFGTPDPKWPGTYPVTVSGGSRSVASKLFPYDIQFKTWLDPRTLRPKKFHGVETEGQEITTSTSTFFHDHVRNVEVNRPDKRSKEKRQETEFRFSPVLDAASAILHVRSQPLNQGDVLTYAFVPINTPYWVQIKVLGRGPHLGQDAIRLSVAMRKIDAKRMKLKPYKKLKSATLWISDDAHRIPLEIRAKVFIGDVRMTLNKVS